MLYTSTRDSTLSCSFEEAICSGYAPDGGLYVPKTLPNINSDILKEWSSLAFPQLAFQSLRMFISPDEIPNSELENICQASFVKGFDDSVGSTIPVRQVGSGSSYIVELSHGPTFCFKDLGMRATVNMLSFFAAKRQKCLTLVVSTTGDTGPACVQAVNDAANPFMTLLVHYPHGQISAFQRKQLTTVRSPYVHVVTFQGGGDDMDLPIKNLQATSGLKGNDKFTVCGVNSYNIGRPLVQLVHFIWTYLRVAEKEGIEPGDVDRPIDIILPTGAMGNIAGGYMAKKMGVPIGQLCAAVNINDITHRAFSRGEFHKSARMEKTLSDAINIQVPYNFERLMFYLTDGNQDLVKEWYSEMEATEKMDLTGVWLEKLQFDFRSARITDEEMCSTMREVHNKFKYFIDPHTSIAVAGAVKLGYNMFETGVGVSSKKVPFAIMSTASPCKFEESVTTAIGKELWNSYVESEFPEKARDIISKDEVEPTVYTWPDDKVSLKEVQKVWESKARKLIVDEFLEKLS